MLKGREKCRESKNGISGKNQMEFNREKEEIYSERNKKNREREREMMGSLEVVCN